MTDQKHRFDDAQIGLRELEPAARLSLRVKPAYRAALAVALGVDLPLRPGRRAMGNGIEVLCLGPDEWTLTAPEAAPVAQAARAVYADAPHSLVDISDREMSLHLTGPAVLDLLSACCPRDLAAMPVGTGARTVFDSATITLWRDGAQDFRMDVWRSFLPHVQSLIAQIRTELSAGL